jgi:NAD(P)-dependent dehydrogenase (short-subunit alcohol dehydrogenase family)
VRNDLFSLDGRTAIVTGGLGQLGRNFTGALIGSGARVAVLDMRPPPPSTDRCLYLEADITDRASLERAASCIESQFGTPHVLVNNAAIDVPPDAPASVAGPFEDFPVEVWRETMDVNVTGTFLCSQVFGARMAAEGRGSIVNVASIYGIVAPDQRIYEYRRRGGGTFFKPAAYAVSKSALLNLTRYLATYWAPRGVRVNTVTFAGVFNDQDPEFLAEYTKRVPLGRMARDDEYNGAIVFLASDASSYMTGANLVLDGGYTAW